MCEEMAVDREAAVSANASAGAKRAVGAKAAVVKDVVGREATVPSHIFDEARFFHQTKMLRRHAAPRRYAKEQFECFIWREVVRAKAPTQSKSRENTIASEATV